MDGWMDGVMEKWVGGWVDGWKEGWVGGWMEKWRNGWVNRWMDGWMEGGRESVNSARLLFCSLVLFHFLRELQHEVHSSAQHPMSHWSDPASLACRPPAALQDPSAHLVGSVITAPSTLPYPIHRHLPCWGH